MNRYRIQSCWDFRSRDVGIGAWTAGEECDGTLLTLDPQRFALRVMDENERALVSTELSLAALHPNAPPPA